MLFGSIDCDAWCKSELEVPGALLVRAVVSRLLECTRSDDNECVVSRSVEEDTNVPEVVVTVVLLAV